MNTPRAGQLLAINFGVLVVLLLIVNGLSYVVRVSGHWWRGKQPAYVRDVDFSMDTSYYKTDECKWSTVVWSKTLKIFHETGHVPKCRI